MSEKANSGIYIISNTLQDRWYIGSAKYIKGRWRNHQRELRENKHGNSKMQRAYNKYGPEIFEYMVAEICKPEELIEREQVWIDIFKPFYNICPRAGSWLGRHHRPETISKMRVPKSEQHKQKLRGRKISDETKRKLSKAMKGRPGHALGTKKSPETIEKMRLANIGRKYPDYVNKKKGLSGSKNPWYGKGYRVVKMDKDGNVLGEYISGHEAGCALGKPNGGTNIIKCCNKLIPRAYGYYWKFGA